GLSDCRTLVRGLLIVGVYILAHHAGLVPSDRLFLTRQRLRRISPLGPQHNRRRHVPLRRRHLRHPLDVRRHLLGHQGVYVDGHVAQRAHLVRDPDALLLLVLVLVRLRRDDGRCRGNVVSRRALARHLLRRCPLSLHHGGQHPHRIPRRAPLLVSEDVRSRLLRALGHGLVHHG